MSSNYPDSAHAQSGSHASLKEGENHTSHNLSYLKNKLKNRNLNNNTICTDSFYTGHYEYYRHPGEGSSSPGP